jgi:hypothetical protein
MILYSLSFVIILIFVYETYKNYKLYQTKLERNRNGVVKEGFDMGDYPSQAENITGVSDMLNNEDYPPLQKCALDTTRTKAFAPLLYDPKRKLYFSRRHLDQEGERQDIITKQQIAKVQALSNAETNPDIKKLYDYELDFHKWRAYPFQEKDNRGNKRLQEDITTDYIPEVFGQQRIWEEVHWHTTPREK